METELFNPTPANELASNVAPASEPAGQPKQQPVISRLEVILDKQARGETLTKQEAGYLGSQRRRKKLAAAAPANPNPLLETAGEAPPPADNPLLASSSPAGMAAESMVATAVDSVRLQAAADALLSSLDIITQEVVGSQAASIPGIEKTTVAKYKSAVALKDGNRKLMVENSEPMVLAACKLFKCTPEKLESVVKSSGLAGGLFLHGFGVWAAIKSINESRDEAKKAAQQSG